LSSEEEIRLKRDGDGEQWRDKKRKEGIDRDKETEVKILT